MNNGTIKNATVLDSEETSRGSLIQKANPSYRWEESKLIQRFRAKFLDVEIVKSLPIGFLYA